MVSSPGVLRRHGVPLVVDEAHGAHLSQHHQLPSGALEQGADLVIQSTHKVSGCEGVWVVEA